MLHRQAWLGGRVPVGQQALRFAQTRPRPPEVRVFGNGSFEKAHGVRNPRTPTLHHVGAESVQIVCLDVSRTEAGWLRGNRRLTGCTEGDDDLARDVVLHRVEVLGLSLRFSALQYARV